MRDSPNIISIVSYTMGIVLLLITINKVQCIVSFDVHSITQ